MPRTRSGRLDVIAQLKQEIGDLRFQLADAESASTAAIAALEHELTMSRQHIKDLTTELTTSNAALAEEKRQHASDLQASVPLS